MNTTCPTCHTTFDSDNPKKAKRKCAECGKQIGRHDKWFFNGEGRVQHRNCADPTNYLMPPVTITPATSNEPELFDSLKGNTDGRKD